MIWLLVGLARAQDNPLPDEPVIVDELVNEVSRPGEPPFDEPDADDDALALRLLGPTPVETAAAAPQRSSPLDLDLAGLWPLGLAAIGMVFLWVARRRTARNPFQTQLFVVGRTPLGGSSALMLVDVAQPGGAMRRLVIATGSGTPTLLADLGDDSPSEPEEEGEQEPQSEPSAPRMRPQVGRVATYAANAAGASGPDRKAAALALIHEVVGTRTGRS